MEAKELRIGNLIYNGLGEILEVNANTIRDFNIGNSILGGFKPIPLTEEILLKAGFEENVGEYSFCKNRFGLYKCKEVFNFELPDGHGGTGCQIDVKYVHQLQNLYFALTGQELEINL